MLMLATWQVRKLPPDTQELIAGNYVVRFFLRQKNALRSFAPTFFRWENPIICQDRLRTKETKRV